MKTFLDTKKWELLLAAVTPFVLVLLDAYQSGAFHGKDVTTGLVIAIGIVLRAAASHRQSPPPAATGDIPGPNPGA